MKKATKKKASKKTPGTTATELKQIERDYQVELENLKKRAARKIRAASKGMDSVTLLASEKTAEAIQTLKEKGLLAPEYEQGNSYKLQVRMPMAWREAIHAEAERRGITQSELVRLGLTKLIPKDVQAELPEVKLGRVK